MKIGILTFWDSSDNYGQLLQAYALQTYFKTMGHEAFLIRFQPLGQSRSILKRIWSLILNPQKIFQRHTITRNLNTYSRHFEEFRKKNLTTTDHIYRSLQELNDSPPVADVYICGSDQVWNVPLQYLDVYLLNFGLPETKRIAYAASLGKSAIPPEQKPTFARLIPRFNAISVREKRSVPVIEELGYPSVQWLPDPTFLLGRQDWRPLEVSQTNIFKTDKKKVFIYTIGNATIDIKESVIQFFHNLSDTQVVHVSSQGDFSGNAYPTINEWITYVNNCDFVVTNSFHGVALSIIFNKNFIALPCSGKQIELNERIISITQFCGLLNHILEEYNEEKMLSIFNEVIDWESVNNQLITWIDKAKEFLDTSISHP